MVIPAFHQHDPSIDTVTNLNRMRVGAWTTIGGIIVHREAEHSFHLEHAGEAMLGTAGTVVDWIQQLRKGSASDHFPKAFPARTSPGNFSV